MSIKNYPLLPAQGVEFQPKGAILYVLDLGICTKFGVSESFNRRVSDYHSSFEKVIIYATVKFDNIAGARAVEDTLRAYYKHSRFTVPFFSHNSSEYTTTPPGEVIKLVYNLNNLKYISPNQLHDISVHSPDQDRATGWNDHYYNILKHNN